MTAEKLDLYDRFHEFQADDKGWPDHGPKDPRDYAESFVDNPFPAEEWCYYARRPADRRRLRGRAAGRPVGHLLLLRPGRAGPVAGHVQRAAGDRRGGRPGLPHVYLGYFVEGCRSLEYKARFRPERGARPPDGTWRADGRHERRASRVVPTISTSPGPTSREPLAGPGVANYQVPSRLLAGPLESPGMAETAVAVSLPDRPAGPPATSSSRPATSPRSTATSGAARRRPPSTPSTSRSTRARSSACSAPTAPARRPPSSSCSACSSPPSGDAFVFGEPAARSRRTSGSATCRKSRTSTASSTPRRRSTSTAGCSTSTGRRARAAGRRADRHGRPGGRQEAHPARNTPRACGSASAWPRR